MYIGGVPGKFGWDGFLDEARLWDHARAEEQIREMINTTCVAGAANAAGLVAQWTFNEGSGEMVVDSSNNKNHGSFDRYAGGVELRRVQSSRPQIEFLRTEREKHIDANFIKLQKWKKGFEDRNGRQPTKADMMLDGEVKDLARRLGEL